MTEINYVVLNFSKTTGEKYNLKVSYPKVPAVGADVKALGEFMVANEIFSFGEGISLSTFDGAILQTISEDEIGLD